MPRRHPRAAPPPRSVGGASAHTAAEFRGETYVVRSVSGQAAAKPYRCPGCDQVITVGTPHVVAWPHGDLDAADRRHWHRGCWTARDRRAPRR